MKVWAGIWTATLLAQIWKSLLCQVEMAVLFINAGRIQSLDTIYAYYRAEDVGLFEIDLYQIRQAFFYVFNCLLNCGDGEPRRQRNVAIKVFFLSHRIRLRAQPIWESQTELCQSILLSLRGRCYLNHRLLRRRWLNRNP